MSEINVVDKMKADMNSLSIQAFIENAKRAIPEQYKAQIDELLPKILPMLTEFAEKKLVELAEKLGTGEEKKFFVMHNIKGKPYIWVMPKSKMKAFDGETDKVYSVEDFLEKLKTYKTFEELLIDLLTLKIFSFPDTPNP